MSGPDDSIVDLTDDVACSGEEIESQHWAKSEYDLDALLRDDAELQQLRSQQEVARAQVERCQRALSKARNELLRIDSAASSRVKVIVDAAEGRIDWIGRTFPWDGVLLTTLREVFKIASFRPLQREAINAVLSGRDVLAIMPTGHGKSLIYQVAAVVDRGVTVVVSPLVALIHDQTKHLRSLRIATYCLDAGTAKEDVDAIFRDVLPAATKSKHSAPGPGAASSSSASWKRRRNPPMVLFVTPERLAKSKKLMSRLQAAYDEDRLTRFTIDEVHCVSNWGHDFRRKFRNESVSGSNGIRSLLLSDSDYLVRFLTHMSESRAFCLCAPFVSFGALRYDLLADDYTQLGVLKRMFPRIPTLCLTATATESVTKDVTESLGIRPVVFRGSMDRPNLFYEVRSKTSAVVEDIARSIKEEFPGDCGIVYVLSRRDSMEVARELREHAVAAGSYHGELTAADRAKTYERWCSGRCQVVVATIAFGLGIDKKDCRFVIHKDFSSSLEGYYQESGRAGRDGKPSKCIVYFSPSDITRLSSFVADKGRKRLAMVYESAKYCLGRSDVRPNRIDNRSEDSRQKKRHKSGGTCRRAMLAMAFGESPPPRFATSDASDGEVRQLLDKGYNPARDCCDICAGSRLDSDTCRLDVTAEALSAVRILRSYATRCPDENLTLVRMATEWGNSGKKGSAFRGEDEPALSRQFSKENRLAILLMCILEGAIDEYHTYGMYNMLAYIRVGHRAAALENGQLQIVIDVDPDSELARIRGTTLKQ